MSFADASCLIGIDLGTTSIKALLLKSSGEVLATCGEEYALDYGPYDTCEIDPEQYWDVTCRVIRKLIIKGGIPPAKIAGMAFSSQGETIIFADSNCKPLRKAIIWLDNRSSAEAEEISAHFGDQLIMDVTGQPEVLPIWPATRILWLRKNEPVIYNKVRKYLLVEDYLIYRMTGEYCTEHSLVSSSLYFDIRKKMWWDEMLDYLGITASQLPNATPSGARIGNLTAEAARATGLNPDVTVVTGSYDHPSGAIGAGNIFPGMASLTIGASMALCTTMDDKTNDRSFRLSCQCHAIHGRYFLLPYSQTAGMVLKWFKDTFCHAEVQQSIASDTDVYEILGALAEKVQPGADGLTMLPQFMGGGSPYFNRKAKGAFAGLTMGMGKGHFVRAIMEAVSAEVNQNIDVLKKRNIPVSEIYFLGGGSRSSLWCQMLADMTGLPVATTECRENASLGAAILAGSGTGIFGSIEEGCKLSVKLQRRYETESRMYESYKGIYENYQRLYKLLEDFW